MAKAQFERSLPSEYLDHAVSYTHLAAAAVAVAAGPAAGGAAAAEEKTSFDVVLKSEMCIRDRIMYKRE